MLNFELITNGGLYSFVPVMATANKFRPFGVHLLDAGVNKKTSRISFFVSRPHNILSVLELYKISDISTENRKKC